MQPICLLLPVGSDVAVRLWSVLELGIQPSPLAKLRHSRAKFPNHAPTLADPAPSSAPDHMHVLATLFRAHLLGFLPCRGGLWLDRRELAGLLRLLECGLARLDLRSPHSENLPLTLESVSTFLAGIRTQLGTLRKPAQRQSALRARAAAAAEN